MDLRTGKFVRQMSGEASFQAFLPNRLPFPLDLKPPLQKLLSEADFELGRLDGLCELLPDVDFFILMYVRKEATLSSQIEGTKATFSDVLKAEAKIDGPEIHSDVDEIRNYIQAMNYGLKRLKDLPLSLRLIREIHGKLLQGVRGHHKMPGEFRRSQNWIGGVSPALAFYVPPPAHELPSLLDNFEKFLHRDTEPIPLLIKAGLLHAQFEAIHPFLDGNGRVGRLLITLYLCERGALQKPLLYLSEFFKQHQQEYYRRLNAAHTEDDLEGWLSFFLSGIITTAKKAYQTSKKILSRKEEDAEKIAAMGKSVPMAIKLFHHLFRTPLIRIKDAERFTGLKNPNAINLVRKFVNAGILHEQSGRKRNRVFAYRKYIELFE